MVAACAVAKPSRASADEIRHPAGFTFVLPQLGKGWAQETHVDVIVVEDDSDTLPELQLFVFPVKREGELSVIAGRLQSEIVRPGVERLGAAIKTAKVIGSPTKQTIADAIVLAGELTLDSSDHAAFAIIQRAGKSLIMIAVPKDGIYERGASNFRAVLQGLKPGNKAVNAASNAPPTTAATFPRLPSIIAIRDITATSTYSDKRDMYAAWRTIAYDAVLDEKTQEYLPTTAWCEGKSDEGIGEGITLNLATPTRLDEIRIAAGVWRSEKLFKENNRITSLDLVIDGVTTTVRPLTGRKWLAVPIGHDVSTITVKIAAIAKGKMNDSCISGISLVRNKGEYAVLTGINAGALEELPRALANLQRTLGTADHGGLAKLVDFPLTVNNVKHANLKSLDAACSTATEQRPTCPAPIAIRSGDERTASVSGPEPSTVEVLFPSQHDLQEAWTLRWHDQAWHLVKMANK